MKKKTEILNYCPFCKKHFNEGEEAYCFRSSGNLFLIAHRGCGPYTETKRVVSSSNEIALAGESKLWRYMDLGKFISMMKNSSLFFSAPKCFKDVFEGAHGELGNKSKWDNYYSNYFRTSLITAPDNCWHHVDPVVLEKNVKNLLKQITERPKNNVFINCWHWNEYESEAMWNLYSSSVDNAVAIQTTYALLKEELGAEVKVKPVHYIDFSRHFADINELYLYKRKSFEYEHEVRAYFYDFSNKKVLGIERRVDLNRLINGVYISPYSPDWYYNLISDLVSRYGYSFNVFRSNMVKQPF
ncbi:MAG: hypothetical protein J5785_06260 [Spirochaetales bacterium]|nr:hypothetical protein [Spirochaetales bacterium]